MSAVASVIPSAVDKPLRVGVMRSPAGTILAWALRTEHPGDRWRSARIIWSATARPPTVSAALSFGAAPAIVPCFTEQAQIENYVATRSGEEGPTA